MDKNGKEPQPKIDSVGLGGVLVRFSNTLSESANRAAIAFRAALDGLDLPGTVEVSSTLTSTYLGFDPLSTTAADLRPALAKLLESRNWYQEPLPTGRKAWTLPVVLGGSLAPQFDEAADLAGLSPEQARQDLCTTQLRVLTLGFAPGQPYLGELPESWALPRQTALTGQVPQGALVVAIRQLTLFTAPAPTGWRHVGQCAFRCFQPEADDPFPLRPGDEMRFEEIDAERYEALKCDPKSNGGARFEVLK